MGRQPELWNYGDTELRNKGIENIEGIESIEGFSTFSTLSSQVNISSSKKYPSGILSMTQVRYGNIINFKYEYYDRRGKTI